MHDNNLFPRQPLPSFLIANTDGYVHDAGAWGLFVPGLKLDKQFPKSSSWIVKLIGEFAQSFPWISFRAAEFGLSTVYQPVTWRSNGENFINWFQKQFNDGSNCGGFTAWLDLDLCWMAPDGSLGESTFKNAGKLLVDPLPISSSTSEIYCCLSIGVNLFSDKIWSEETSDWVNILTASRINRQRIKESLRSYELKTQGEIREWESRLVHGVSKYGFCDTSVEL